MGICGSKMVKKTFFDLKYWRLSYQNTSKNRSKLRSLSKSEIKELDNLELIKELYKDPGLYKESTDFIKKNRYSNLVVFGMGGSSLGTKAIFEASNYSKKSKKNLHIVNNIDGESFEKFFKEIKIKDSFLIFVSKSGDTIEIKNLVKETFKKISEKKVNHHKQVLFITESRESFLHKFARAKKVQTFYINENLGGRFSALSPSSMIPCELAGINSQEILIGAKDTYDKLKTLKFTPVIKLANFYYNNYLDGRDISVLMPYKDNLNSFGEWFMQLWGESLGKQRQNKKNIGLTPINYLGPRDQHSQMQLVLDGPKNKTITFITVRKSQESNKRLESLALLEQAATLEATKERKIPSVKFEIKKLDGPTLGSIFLVFQLTVILLARNLNINPFNQPAVELIKKRLES